MRTSNRVNKHAFTFVEVMCVMIIISIVSSIALPAINNFHSAERCKAEASVLVSYIRQAKYQALQDNCVNRLIFSPENEGNSGNIFKIQKYEPVNVAAEGAEYNSLSDIISSSDEDEDIKYDADNWTSLADTEEIELNSSVEVDLALLDLQTTTVTVDGVSHDLRIIYFNTDGFLYDSDGNKISEQRIIFRYGSSAVAVDINALGVISSEAIPNDEDNDEYFDDKHNENEDDPTKYDS